MQKQTVFIVGAGASKEAGLPVARELATRIAATLNIVQPGQPGMELGGDGDIIDVINQNAVTGNERGIWLDAARLVSQGVVYSNSIDSFIDTHKDNDKVQFLGKLAIAKTILQAEQASLLYIDDRMRDANFHGMLLNVPLSETWFVRLFRNLADGVRKSEVERIFERVSFVVFNYDRCIEHFFYNALQKSYGIDESDALPIIASLRIYHPYGTVSPLNWQSENGIPFGFTPNRRMLVAASSNIKTYTEQVHDGELLNKIREAVKSADIIVFLGFSYHHENMKLLSPGAVCNAKKILGTAVGISVQDIEKVTSEIRDVMPVSGGPAPIIAYECKCSDLLQRYSRSLFTAGGGG